MMLLMMILLLVMMLMDEAPESSPEVNSQCPAFGSETLKETHLWLLLDVASDDNAHDAHAFNDNAFDAPNTHGGW